MNGHNSAKTIDVVSILVPCTSTDGGLYILTKAPEITLNSVRVIEWTRKVNGQTSNGRRPRHNTTCFDGRIEVMI